MAALAEHGASETAASAASTMPAVWARGADWWCAGEAAHWEEDGGGGVACGGCVACCGALLDGGSNAEEGVHIGGCGVAGCEA